MRMDLDGQMPLIAGVQEGILGGDEINAAGLGFGIEEGQLPVVDNEMVKAFRLGSVPVDLVLFFGELWGGCSDRE